MSAPAGAWQPVRRHGSRVRREDAAAALGALGLLGCLLGLRWFGAVTAEHGSAATGRLLALGAWGSLTVTSWLLAAGAAAALVAALLGPRARPVLALPVLALAVAAAGCAAYRVLLDPPQPDRVVDVKLGAYLGLLCAGVMALGAAEAWRGADHRLGSGSGRARTLRRDAR